MLKRATAPRSRLYEETRYPARSGNPAKRVRARTTTAPHALKSPRSGNVGIGGCVPPQPNQALESHKLSRALLFLARLIGRNAEGLC